MANKIIPFGKPFFDPAANQFFQLILIDGGANYTLYVKDVPAPTVPGLASQISASGAVPVIAPSGGGDVVGLGTTNTLMLWTDGPNSVAGDSIVSQNAGATQLTVTGQMVVTGHVALEGGTPQANTILDITNAAIAPSAAFKGINLTLTNPLAQNLVGFGMFLTQNANNTNFRCVDLLSISSASLSFQIGIALTQVVSATFTTTALTSLNLNANTQGTATTTIGVDNVVTVGAAGSITTLNLYTARTSRTAGSSIGTLNYLNLSGSIGAGTVTESRGIFIDTSIDIGTTRYAILSRSTSDSRIVGNVRIGGDTAPVATLDVTGTIGLTSTIVFPDGVRQTFNPDATTPGLNVGSNAGDPSTPSNGDVWYDSTGNLLRARVNGATVSLSSFAIGGSNTQLQYNNAGALGGISGATTNGTSVTFGSGNLLATSPVFTTDITTPLILSGSTASGGIIRINTTTNSTKGWVAIDGTTAGVGLLDTNLPAFFSNSVAVFGMHGILNTFIRSDGYYGFSANAGISPSDTVGATLSYGGSSGLIQFGTTAANASGSWLATNGTLSGNLIMNGAASVIRLKGYTVATLPAGTQGDTAFVTDALAPTFLATVVGGGAVVTPVFFNGAAWVGY